MPEKSLGKLLVQKIDEMNIIQFVLFAVFILVAFLTVLLGVNFALQRGLRLFLSAETRAEVRRIDEANERIVEYQYEARQLGITGPAYLDYPKSYKPVQTWSGIISFLITSGVSVRLASRWLRGPADQTPQHRRKKPGRTGPS